MQADKTTATELREVLSKPYWRGPDGQAVIAAWRRSGLDLGTFCRKHGVKPDRVRWWRDKLAGAKPVAAVTKRPQKQGGSGITFVPAGTVSDLACNMSEAPSMNGLDDVEHTVDVEFPSGIVVRVPEGTRAPHLVTVLKAASTVGAQPWGSWC